MTSLSIDYKTRVNELKQSIITLCDKLNIDTNERSQFKILNSTNYSLELINLLTKKRNELQKEWNDWSSDMSGFLYHLRKSEMSDSEIDKENTPETFVSWLNTPKTPKINRIKSRISHKITPIKLSFKNDERKETENIINQNDSNDNNLMYGWSEKGIQYRLLYKDEIEELRKEIYERKEKERIQFRKYRIQKYLQIKNENINSLQFNKYGKIKYLISSPLGSHSFNIFY